MNERTAHPASEGVGLISPAIRKRFVASLAEYYTHNGRVNQAVKHALEAVPRHRFVESAFAEHAYTNNTLPIGHQQTISEPALVAYMSTQMHEHCAMHKVLEIGTGCGYQCAVLANLADTVYSVERIEALHKHAAHRLADLGVHNVHCLWQDGYEGLADYAPFDGVMLTAACPEIPEVLLAELAVGGVLIAPVGKTTQQLVMVKKEAQKNRTGFKRYALKPVRFVPMLAARV